jgi:hypothetical protein
VTTPAPTRRVSWLLTSLLTLIWAVLGTAIATVTWAAITGVLVLTEGRSLGWVPPAFRAGIFYGGFVALLSLVPYWVLFLFYARLLARRPTIEATVPRFLRTAFWLALPVALVVFISFLEPWSPFGAFWGQALGAGPVALISAWIGIATPRLLIRSWRPGTWWVAA